MPLAAAGHLVASTRSVKLGGFLERIHRLEVGCSEAHPRRPANQRAGTHDLRMAESPRRFPSPWHADPMPGGYVVRDTNGQALAYVYSRDNEDEARQGKVLTEDEARRIAIKNRTAA
jgi:hypothetical protein